MFRRRPEPAASASTLAAELTHLEFKAQQQLDGTATPYSRSRLADESSISRRTLDGWFAGQSAPQDAARLMRVVSLLCRWARQPAPDQRGWQARLDLARARPSAQPRPERLRRVLAISAATAAVGAIVTLVVTQAPGWIGLGSSQRPATASTLRSPAAQPAESLQASAAWCCKFATSEDYVGYYWPGSPDSFASTVLTAGTGAMREGGTAVIEIPLQTSGREPIYVAPPQVVVTYREPNVSTGIIGFIPLASEGTGTPSQFTTDLDAARPETVPYGADASASGATNDFYVSSGSPEVLLLTVRDEKCDCAFDIRLTWQAQGRTQSETLDDHGQPFHMVGSSGLHWYTGNPAAGPLFLKPGTGLFPAN